jgi:hypothetical protein
VILTSTKTLKTVDASNFNFSTTTDFFYGSKSRINSRAEQGFFNINGGGVGYMGAQNFLAQRSTKRKEMLEAFKKGLRFINEKCPYYFQSISGLDQLLKVDIKNLHKAGGKPQRMGTLNIECLESIDMRIFALAELYRKAIYDYTYHRVMLPENLRKFRMWLVVSEIRNIQLSYGINDVLNPFSIPSVAQGANFLDSFNTQTGLLDNAAGLLQTLPSKASSTTPQVDTTNPLDNQQEQLLLQEIEQEINFVSLEEEARRYVDHYYPFFLQALQAAKWDINNFSFGSLKNRVNHVKIRNI